MHKIYWLPFSSALLLILTGCANNGGSAGNDPLGTGPFDSRGNYREEWANDPSKWRKPGSRSQPAASSDDVPVIAKNDQPPPNANPLAPSGAANSKKTPIQVSSLPRETTHRAETSKPEVAHTTPRVVEPRPSGTKGKSKTTAHVAKSKPKAKSKSGRYVVKQGDNLWDIARRNGSSVAAIQKANDISGTLIHPGKSLTIPKH